MTSDRNYYGNVKTSNYARRPEMIDFHLTTLVYRTKGISMMTVY